LFIVFGGKIFFLVLSLTPIKSKIKIELRKIIGGENEKFFDDFRSNAF